MSPQWTRADFGLPLIPPVFHRLPEIQIRTSCHCRNLFFAVLLAVVCGCARTALDPDPSLQLPIIKDIRVTGDSTTGTTAIVTLAAHGESAFAQILSNSAVERTTPPVALVGDLAVIRIFGLTANQEYLFRIIVSSLSGGPGASAFVRYSTDSLPGTLPRIKILSSQSPTIRYVMLGMTPAQNGKSYAMIVNNEGTTVWYKAFLDAVVDFQKQPNGRYTAWSSIDGSPSHFYEFDQQGIISAEYKASNGLDTDPHELRIRGDSYALFGLESRTMDLRSVGGLASASVDGFVVEYHRPGRAPFLWNTFDHFAVTDAAPDILLNGATVDPWHGNAIEIDDDGNFLVSFRNTDEISKINAETGEIIWRLGGKNNQFTFLGDDLNGFSHQHGIRRIENGDILLFDNGNLHSPPMSRAVEYRLDENAKTAKLVWEFRPSPPIFSFALGFAQRLSNGNTLVCFGTAQHIMEVDKNRVKRWDAIVDATQRFAYRAFAVESLYR